jgi:DNA-binding CsgD family transcriptional regulator
MPQARRRGKNPVAPRDPGHMQQREQALYITRALEALRVPSAAVDRDGRIRWLNRGATELVGDRVGEPFPAVIAPEDRRVACDNFSRKLAGEADSSTYAVTLLALGGERVRVRVSSVPFWEGDRIAGAFGIAWPVRLSGPSVAAAPSLTGRQRQTLALLAEGLGTAAIAERLGIAEETARNHIRGLLGALCVHSRLEAVVEAHRLGLVQPRRPD